MTDISPQEEQRSAKKGIIRALYDWVLSWADTPYGTPALFVMAFAESSFFPIPPDVLQIALSASKPKRSFWYATVSLVGSVLGAFLGFLIGFAFWTATQDFFYNNLFNRETFAVVAGDEMAGVTREQRSTVTSGKKVKLVCQSDVPKEVHKIEIVCCSNAKARLHDKEFKWVREEAEQTEFWCGIKLLNSPKSIRKYVFQFSKTDESGNPTDNGYISSVLFYGEGNQVLDSFDIMLKGLYHEHGFWAILITAPTPIPYKLFTIAAGVCGISLWILFIASVLGRSARFYAVAVVMYYFGPSVMRLFDKYFNILSIIFVMLLVGGFVSVKFVF
ncbi:MAG: hypothetical protein FWE67_06860 [Planctomycetaceae bacterium]|nr:hypothetical protein [Planctomycetaceae bacterium]